MDRGLSWIARPLRNLPAVAALISLAGCVGPQGSGPGGGAVDGGGVGGDGGGGPETPAVNKPAIDWRTPKTLLRAKQFTLEAGGHEFQADVDEVDLSGDPGDEGYATLEATWFEDGVEMRLYTYFTSDGVEWWSDEIRTYDGAAPGEWITYEGEWFRSPLGEAFVGHVELETTPGAPIAGRVSFQGLVVQSFLGPDCDDSAYTLASPYAVLDVPEPPAFFRTYVDVLDASCEPMNDTTPFDINWTLDDPIAEITADGAVAELRAIAPGETLARVELRDGATGELLATVAIPVVVD